MDYNQEALRMHKEAKGKIEVISKVPVETRDDLSIAYTPGVAQPCREIYENPDDVYLYTSKGNMIAIVSDGSAVLGLGNIGAKAALPVMEGKAILFKRFANVDAFPICLDTQDVDEIVETCVRIAPVFGGINLEDISAPRCFEVENKLKALLDIPIFHDDQHGTAIVVSAGLINALKLVGKRMEDVTIVINGIGAAGAAICLLLEKLGAKHIVPCGRDGIMHALEKNMNWMKEKLVGKHNPDNRRGTLADALCGADVFIGVSAPHIITEDMARNMANDAIIFAMSNPTPEIMPDVAKAAGVRVIGTGRSDFVNQINNCIAFPGIFRGALDARASAITEEMKIAAAHAIAGLIKDDELHEEYIIPSALDNRVAGAVAEAVRKVALKN